jgi:[acyl-carrier-protein] S-malonyltransferase
MVDDVSDSIAAPTTAVAGLFPGQGSQTSDLRELVARAVPDLLVRAIELVGEDPFERLTESTRFAQPAIYCGSVAGWLEYSALVRPLVALAGHSLGELAALVAAGAIDQYSGLELAVTRGALMAEASEGEVAESMLALLGAEPERAEQLAHEHGVLVANDNAPGQMVLAGPVGALRAAGAAARGEGLRAMLLDVAGAFHTPAMAGAVDPYRQVLAQVQFHEPAVPVISCASAAPFQDVREELAQAIIRPVRWRQTMVALGEAGAEQFLDFGPGAVLAKLVKRNLPQAAVIKLEDLRELPFAPTRARGSTEPSSVA